MTEWLTFEGLVEPLEWGRATYTIMRLPSDIATQLSAAKVRRVEGEFNDHPVNLAITRAPVVDGAFLWAGKTLLDQTGITPGIQFEARLRPAPDDLVELPPDVSTALLAHGALSAWETLTPGKRRGLLYPISTAKTGPTRAKRIATLVNELGQ